MKKIITVVLLIAAAGTLASCSVPGADIGIEASKIKWSFARSPKSGACYEFMTMYNSAGYATTTYSGMARVDDKYCK